MEKFCVFCSASRPVVYCKADAAHLCLYCDAKVHSANNLFNRHMRTILCDLCRYRPAFVQCLDHKMFMCRACDRAPHISSQHQKRAISSYTGCPSAKDFAALWGIELNDLDNNSAHLDGTFSTSCGSSCDSCAVNLDSREQSCSQVEGPPSANSPTLVPGAESEVGSSSQRYKISHERQEHKSTCFILHQILDLKRLQLTEGSSPSLPIRSKVQSDLSSSAHHTSNRFNHNVDQRLQHSQNTGTKCRQRDSLLQDLKVDHFPFPFSQLENMPPSSTAGLPSHTDSFWQCRSPVQSSQLWAQNMQDIGVCEELVCHDDLNIPDVDMTFRNFEELFGGDQDPIKALPADKDVSYSSVEKDISLDKSDNGRAGAALEHDASEVSSMFIDRSGDLDKDKGPNKVQNLEGSMDSPCPPLRPSSSTLSFCFSRFSGESSGNDWPDSQLSPYNAAMGGSSSNSSPHDKEGGRLLERKNQYSSRKAKPTADIHVGGQKEELSREKTTTRTRRM